MASEQPSFTVSEFIAITNQVLEGAYPSVVIEGEVASFKVNQGKFVFFDIKDAEASVGCFMTVWQLKIPIEDGMKVRIRATAKLTNWGKFSLTVLDVRPVGEGSIKKSFELLKAKLEKEGLFEESRKRILPPIPKKVAVISSTQAAGYIDFITILSERWGGLDIEVAHTQVQGEAAPQQMIRATKYFNERTELADVLVIIRGGGSADDLACFNDEELVRTIASSRIPTMVGVGHEIDTTLADLVADKRAVTPSNAAQLLVPDRMEVIEKANRYVVMASESAERRINELIDVNKRLMSDSLGLVLANIDKIGDSVKSLRSIISAYNPSAVLSKGYALVRGEILVGSEIEIETKDNLITAGVQNVRSK